MQKVPDQCAMVYKNSNDCPHCGLSLAQRTELTAVINRSDGRMFHLFLYSGPNPRLKFGGGVYQYQLSCIFLCSDNHAMPRSSVVTVIIITWEGETSDTVLEKIENAADQLAELIQEREPLTAVYTFKGWKLTPGFPI